MTFPCLCDAFESYELKLHLSFVGQHDHGERVNLFQSLSNFTAIQLGPFFSNSASAVDHWMHKPVNIQIASSTVSKFCGEPDYEDTSAILQQVPLFSFVARQAIFALLMEVFWNSKQIGPILLNTLCKDGEVVRASFRPFEN